MKQGTLNTLITARALFDKAQELCTVDEKYLASAGLVILQDALELVLYGCLLEIGADQDHALDSMTFDQLIGELRKRGKPVRKAGTLKALNKQRVIVKHYGQIAEPATVRTYFDAAREAADALLRTVVGLDLQEIVLSLAVKDAVVRDHLEKAIAHIESGEHYLALIEIRKSLYLSVEKEYSIAGWSDHPQGKQLGFLEASIRGGWKAPYYAKNKEWIEANVHDPFDFIRIDHEKLRIDLLEWGVATQDFWNVWRLTPRVYLDETLKEWFVNIDPKYFGDGASVGNARYCLDRAVSLIVKKQSHLDLAKQLDLRPDAALSVRMKSDATVYRRASKDSGKWGEVFKGKIYDADTLVPALAGGGSFIKIMHFERDKEPLFIVGYVPFEDCEILKGVSRLHAPPTESPPPPPAVA